MLIMLRREIREHAENDKSPVTDNSRCAHDRILAIGAMQIHDQPTLGPLFPLGTNKAIVSVFVRIGKHAHVEGSLYLCVCLVVAVRGSSEGQQLEHHHLLNYTATTTR